MAVRIRLKRMGRTHRPFYRVCAMDQRSPRNGRVIEELGYYDPLVKETDARAILQSERIDYWLSVGAQPSDKVRVLIKKYGSNGTHVDAQRQALERLKIRPAAPAPVSVPLPKDEPAAEATPEAPAEAPAAAAEEAGEPAAAESAEASAEASTEEKTEE